MKGGEAVAGQTPENYCGTRNVTRGSEERVGAQCPIRGDWARKGNRADPSGNLANFAQKNQRSVRYLHVCFARNFKRQRERENSISILTIFF